MSKVLNSSFFTESPFDQQFYCLEYFVDFIHVSMDDLKLNKRYSQLKHGLEKENPFVERKVICNTIFEFLHFFLKLEKAQPEE